MLQSPSIPGLLVTGTDTGIGKTVIAGAIADWFRRQRHRVAVLKPAGSGCVRRREGLVSEDAEFLAHCADARFPLDVICPVRYAEPLAPAIAGERAKRAEGSGSHSGPHRICTRVCELSVCEGMMIPS